MASESSVEPKALRLEIGQAPKMAFLGNLAEIPAIPEGPAVWIVETGPSDALPPIHRFGDAVDALIWDKPAPWIIQVREPARLSAGFNQLLSSRTSALLYMPYELSPDDLARTRSMLECLGYQPECGNASSGPRSSVMPALEAARQRRAQLLKDEHWLNAGDVHLQQGGTLSAPGASNTASRLRRKGELLGAWDGHEYQHPAFQFDQKTGRVMPEMRELLEILPKDQSGWRQVFWIFQPHALLDGLCPADVFQDKPRMVIEAAQSTFEPVDTNW